MFTCLGEKIMQKEFLILTINPGSTSTKVAVFLNEQRLYERTIKHESKELEAFDSIIHQLDYRTNSILTFLEEKEIDLEKLHAISARGGLVRPIPSGTYEIDEVLLEDLTNQKLLQHASNLGAPIANSLAKKYNIPMFIVDPVVVDEMEPIAKITGFPLIKRRSIFHALNQKAVARKYAKEIHSSYEDLRLLVCHMGGGITVGAHIHGKVVDVTNGLDGEGPFTPERAGAIPASPLVQLCFSGKLTEEEILKTMVGKGGLVSLVHTNNAIVVEERIHGGDELANDVLNAMAYQIAKEIGSYATVLKGQIDAIILTGGLAHSKMFIQKLTERIQWMSKVVVIPGEDEMLALCQGALRVLTNEEKAKNYQQMVQND